MIVLNDTEPCACQRFQGWILGDVYFTAIFLKGNIGSENVFTFGGLF